MLCKRPTKKIEDSIKEMGGVEFIIEEKLDGERMQLHKRGNEYFYCSRQVPSINIRHFISNNKRCVLGKEKIILIFMVVMSAQEV